MKMSPKLLKLCTSFMGHSRWKTFRDHRSKYPGTKWTCDGWRHAKTALEQLSSTDESEEGVPQASTLEQEPRMQRNRGGNTEFIVVLQSTSMMSGDDKTFCFSYSFNSIVIFNSIRVFNDSFTPL